MVDQADESCVTLTDGSGSTAELMGLGQDGDSAPWVMRRSREGHGQFCLLPGLAVCLGSSGTEVAGTLQTGAALCWGFPGPSACLLHQKPTLPSLFSTSP